MIRVGIYGASGYAGQELLRLLARHPEVEVTALTSRKYKGQRIDQVYPAFGRIAGGTLVDSSPEEVAPLCDAVFLSVPHGEAMLSAPVFLDAGVKVIDLSADFRLRRVDVYETWYQEHRAAHLIPRSVYGLPEIYREEIRKASLVANPGCYPTSAILGLAPLLKAKKVRIDSIVVDSKSGTSGAGRDLQLGSLFCEVNEGFKAYKVAAHRHTPEIEQELSVLAGEEVRVSFVPHLIPVNRGILSTIYATLASPLSQGELDGLYREFYDGEYFVRIYEPGTFPNISSIRGSNFCDIGFTAERKTGRVIVVSVIDNLIKGAAGQAIQNMNLLFGLPETTALDLVPLFP